MRRCLLFDLFFVWIVCLVSLPCLMALILCCSYFNRDWSLFIWLCEDLIVLFGCFCLIAWIQSFGVDLWIMWLIYYFPINFSWIMYIEIFFSVNDMTLLIRKVVDDFVMFFRCLRNSFSYSCLFLVISLQYQGLIMILWIFRSSI